MSEQPKSIVPTQPRARGEVRALFDCPDRQSRLVQLRQAGSSRALFPRTESRQLQLVLTNTSGGVTGGDRFRTDIAVCDGAQICVTTQAAERAYRAQPGQIGRIDTSLKVTGSSQLHWLPQETILFDGCAFARRLTVELDPDAAVLVVEPIVFGRSAMNESLSSGMFDDRIEVISQGQTVFLDRTFLSGDIEAILRRPGVARGMHAAALVLLAKQGAEGMLPKIREILPASGGASLPRPDLLLLRLLAADAYELRQSLVPVIELLHQDVIPRPWMI